MRASRAALGVLAIASGCALPPVALDVDGDLSEGDARHPVDGAYYDEVRFDADEGWRVRIEMRSEEIDPFLQLRLVGASESDFLRESDDADEGSTTARIEVRAPRRGRYVLWASSYEPAETGSYRLRVQAGPERRP